MDIYKEVELNDCPFCGGAALLEEEGKNSWYVMCTYCGSQTTAFEYKNEDERIEAAKTAAHIWNIGKIIRSGVGE